MTYRVRKQSFKKSSDTMDLEEFNEKCRVICRLFYLGKSENRHYRDLQKICGVTFFFFFSGVKSVKFKSLIEVQIIVFSVHL